GSRAVSTSTGVRSTLARSLLILSGGSGSMTAEVDRRLRAAFSDSLVLDFDPDHDFREHITADARVVVAGGDGTVGFVCRALIDSRRTLGIIPLGTYNNFARALGLPARPAPATRVARSGVPDKTPLGRLVAPRHPGPAAVGEDASGSRTPPGDGLPLPGDQRHDTADGPGLRRQPEGGADAGHDPCRQRRAQRAPAAPDARQTTLAC